jgi:hypothetical protein
MTSSRKTVPTACDEDGSNWKATRHGRYTTSYQPYRVVIHSINANLLSRIMSGKRPTPS